MTSSKLLLIAMGAIALGCTGAQRTSATSWDAVTEAPREAFDACAQHAPGDACTVHIDEVEALGNCAPPPATIQDRRLICTT